MAAAKQKPCLKRRLMHLWGLAVQCSEENPELSRFYVNEILSTDNGMNGVEFWMKYCQHCGVIFKGDNCRVRMQPKRRNKKNKKKNSKEEYASKCLNKKQVLNLPRKFSHVGVFCQGCGQQSFYPSKAWDKRPRTKRLASSSTFTAKQNDSKTQDTTPVLSKSAKARRRSRTSKLKDILLADERQKSTTTGSSPQLQDFLSSLGHSVSF